jgi:hypothetical protein
MHGIEIKMVTEFLETLKVLGKDLVIFLVILLYNIRIFWEKNIGNYNHTDRNEEELTC